MSQEAKPREFWIWKDYDKVTWDFTAQANKPVFEDRCFHVIEKSYADQLQAELADFKAREIAHLALIQDLQKGIKAKDELLRECEQAMEAVLYNNHTTTLRFSELIYLALRKIKKLREIIK